MIAFQRRRRSRLHPQAKEDTGGTNGSWASSVSEAAVDSVALGQWFCVRHDCCQGLWGSTRPSVELNSIRYRPCNSQYTGRQVKKGLRNRNRFRHGKSGTESVQHNKSSACTNVEASCAKIDHATESGPPDSYVLNTNVVWWFTWESIFVRF